METPELGSITKVDPREVWPDEAQDFTPWLAEEENLGRLASTIGLDLELEGTEKNVGPFSADILCRDTVDDQMVLIENQLNLTDHGHLGQLLTYAAGLDAVTIIWIARQVRNPHRAALDWLNSVTEEEISFFGIEIELWQIGSSPVAPKFNLASKPNDWSKTVSRASGRDGELTETKKLQLDYWTALSERLEEQGSQVQPRTPRPQHWANYAVGRSGCQLTARVNTRDQRVAVQLALKDQEEAEPLFHLLKQEKDAIEGEIGVELSWLPKPDKKVCVVQHEWKADPMDRDEWPEQHSRMRELLGAFHRAFSTRLRELDASEWSPEASERARIEES
ncbi:hypothetical protein GGP72_003288 [Salinibacter ruber]|uniref:DUF4268 domain-containing protein n=1 Tax=Salinibacter ruber TaxID=146919 RepID=A0A9X2Q172_9BACT|nr:DUF4268 domain-containing protein [Salinibacter ruber]MCS3679338.1 hypothetical protein [Salinibacter ruber]MCS3682624.1 hypothetical protein [Salinibacter ruber]